MYSRKGNLVNQFYDLPDSIGEVNLVVNRGMNGSKAISRLKDKKVSRPHRDIVNLEVGIR